MEVMNNRDKDKNIQEESKIMPQPKDEAETLKNLPDTTPPKVFKAPPIVFYVTAGALVLAVGGALIAGIVPRFLTETELVKETKIKEAIVASPAVVVHHAQGDSSLVLPANLQAVQEIPIFARAAGYLRERLVDIGDKVHAGQTLAIIDAPELDKELDQAKADLKEAGSQVKSVQADLARSKATLANSKATLKRIEANLNFSQRQIGRYVELENEGAISREMRDEKQRDLESDKATIEASKADVVANESQVISQKEKVEVAYAKVESAKANLDRVKSLNNFKHVTAPCDGIITARYVDAGALVNEGSNSNVQELLRLSRIDVLRVFVSVPQNFYQKIQPGMKTTVTVAELPHQKFIADVTRVSGGLDATSRTMQAEIRINNSAGLLKPGMFAYIDFLLKKDNSRNAPLLIPASSLVVKPEGLFVATVNPKGSVHFAKVTLGRDYGKEMEVTKGITDGETILLDPDLSLKEGSQVKTEMRKTDPA